MENNNLASEYLKYSYGFFLVIYDIINYVDDELYIQLLLPMLYYFTEYKNVAEYIFQNFSDFQKFLRKLSFLITKKYKNILKNINNKEFEESLNDLQENHILNCDRDFVSFKPLRLYFLNNKNEMKFYSDPDQNKCFALKLHIILELLLKLNCTPLEYSPVFFNILNYKHIN